MLGRWSAETSLPLALCDVALLVAAAACWWRLPLLVELTWFWGMAGTLQAVATPDLGVAFPHLVFFQYVVGHEGIVLAALLLVVGMRIVPRPGAVPRVLAITVGYTVLVGLVDAVTGANYMYLRSPPGSWTVLRLLGPWPWLPRSGVAAVLVVVLDSPFWADRHRRAEAGDGGARPGGFSATGASSSRMRRASSAPEAVSPRTPGSPSTGIVPPSIGSASAASMP